MKKITALILLLCLVMSIFAGCGDKIDDGPVPNPNLPAVSGDNQPGADIPNAPDNTDLPSFNGEFDYTGATLWNGYNLSFVKDNGLEYIWEHLDNETRANLASALTAIKNADPFIPLEYSIDKATNEEFMKLILNCAMDYPYVVNKFGVQTVDDGGTVIALTARFNFDVVETEEDCWALTNQLNARLDEIVSGMPANADEFEQLRYLHDSLVFFSDYSEDTPLFYTAYGALVAGRATCQGYADAMHLLLARAGFETCFCIGVGNNTAVTHKWNYVKLSDGQWYILDPTWADPADKTDPDYISYDYFLISDEELMKDHKEKYQSIFFEVPEATSMEHNYHKTVGYYCTTYEEAVAAAEEQVRLCAEEGRRYLYFRVSDETLYDQINTDLLTAVKEDKSNGELLRIIKDVNAERGNVFGTSGWEKYRGHKDGEGPLTFIITLRDPK